MDMHCSESTHCADRCSFVLYHLYVYNLKISVYSNILCTLQRVGVEFHRITLARLKMSLKGSSAVLSAK